jgi:AraC family transcriptional regulator
VDSKPMQITGLSEVHKGQGKGTLHDQWMRFAPLIGKIPGQTSNVAYGIMFDAAGGFEYMCGVETSGEQTASGELEQITLPAAKYAVFPHHGDVSTIWQTVSAIHHDWVPTSGHELGGRPQLLERYGEKFDPATSSGDIEVWIPLKS